jgi:serine/threonine-protein kinase
MVTELMGGGDVEGLIEKADGPLPTAQALEIAKAVCRGLEFAHAKGVVHRDLKPGNVWLTTDGVAKIGDFGLAVALDRSRLTMHGMMVGTVSYMPPEQALGGEVTPQSDLYSLGAMLYEMVTGHPPFVGSDPTAVISQHINIPPSLRAGRPSTARPPWSRSSCRCWRRTPRSAPRAQAKYSRDSNASTPPRRAPATPTPTSLKAWPAASSSAARRNWSGCAKLSTTPSPGMAR